MPAAAITGAVETTACREMLLNQINNLNDGAFAPWSTQPVVKAVLLSRCGDRCGDRARRT
jgi:hypothetical protein